MRRFLHLSRRIGLALQAVAAGSAVSSCWQSNPTCCNADLTSCVTVDAGELACVGGSLESAAEQAAASSNGFDEACQPVAIQGASPCATGTCSTLATGLATPSALAIDAVNLYFTAADGTVDAVPRGGGVVTRLASGQNSPTSVAVSGTDVFWVTSACSTPILARLFGGATNDFCQGGVSRVPIAGGSPAVVTTAVAGGLAADPSGVYWTASFGLCPDDLDAGPVALTESDGGFSVETTGAGATTQPAVLCFPADVDDAAITLGGTDVDSGTGLAVACLSGGDGGWVVQGAEGGAGGPAPGGAFDVCAGEVMGWNPSTDDTTVLNPFEQISLVLSPGAVATDAQNVYFATSSFLTSGSIMKVPKTGGDVVVLASGYAPLSIAVGATSVYWTDSGSDGDSGGVFSVPIDGGAVTSISAALNPSGIAVDGASVYWTTMGSAGACQTDGTVMKASLDGSDTVTLAAGEYGPVAVVVDESSVYWIDQGLAPGTAYATGGTLRKLTPK
jgi:hypothetical protein